MPISPDIIETAGYVCAIGGSALGIVIFALRRIILNKKISKAFDDYEHNTYNFRSNPDNQKKADEAKNTYEKLTGKSIETAHDEALNRYHKNREKFKKNRRS